MMKCSFCGEELEDDSLFCTSCGNMISHDNDLSDIQQEYDTNVQPLPFSGDDGADETTVSFDSSDSAENAEPRISLFKPLRQPDTPLTDLEPLNETVPSDNDITAELPSQNDSDEWEPAIHDAGQNEAASDETAPASGETTPASGETTPASGETAPASGETAPASGESDTASLENDTAILHQPDEKEPKQTSGSSDRNSETIGKLTLAVMLLAGALLALTGYLFADKFYFSRTSPGKQTITIISQPEDVTAKEDSTVVFLVEAKGKNLTYQWYYRKPGDEYWHLWKQHDQAKTIANANSSWNGMQVYCVITDNYRHTLSTDIATVVIKKDKKKKTTENNSASSEKSK